MHAWRRGKKAAFAGIGAAAAIAGSLFGAGVGTAGAAPAVAATSSPPATPGAICGTTARPTHINHVIWLWMENQPYNALIGSSKAPYLNKLADECGLATNYHNITHPSAPEYLAATSGYLGGKSDCGPSGCPDPHNNIFNQTTKVGETWASYEQSMPTNCDNAFLNLYDVNHNPAVYYPALASQCAKYDVPMGTLESGNLVSALRSKLPSFSFITPNLINDSHNSNVATGDQFLSRIIPLITGSSYYKEGDTALFLLWDEGEGGATNNCATNTTDIGCHVPAVVINPAVPSGFQSATLFNHYSLLKTAEQLLGLRYLGNANEPDTQSMASVFNLK